MNLFQSLVRDFHQRVTKQPFSPLIPMLRNPRLRACLVIEEAIELAFALVGAAHAQTIIQELLIRVLNKSTKAGELGPDVLRAIGETCDVIVVAAGTGEDIGVDLEPFYVEIMKANLAKEGGPVDENGKKLKPSGWTPPNLKKVFDQVVANHTLVAAGSHVCGASSGCCPNCFWAEFEGDSK